ncbi:hypothetical protein M409DRAFT_18717 [Zasmidium cellare ATCC 36951]|uniref:Uncharacterized protein n=1 Tax=Zasmidium cellare ATCC 36951 TaxID=1080233 RepID=A0A6A6CUL9_ZASCE|nr:uncharacterized protein M409DRAFT_18717 [Zasmidium cellare ATCC 36951]KAF2170745.1 hypothetical protein M409DRAFT_18717 [Zasmidium cellare ATCC 36951]
MELKEAHRAEKLMHQTQDMSQHAVIVTHLQRALVLEQHLQEFGRPSGRLHSWLMQPSKYGDNTPRATMYGVDAAQLEGHMHIEYGQTDDESEGEQGPSEVVHPVANNHGRPSSTSATAQQVTQAASPPAQEHTPSSLGHTTATSVINNGNGSSAVAQRSQGILVHVSQSTPTSSHWNGSSVVASAGSSSRQDATSTQQVGPLPAIKSNEKVTNVTAVEACGEHTKKAPSVSAQTLDLSSLIQNISATIGSANNSSKNETAGYDGDSESGHVNASDDETDSSDDDATTAHKVQRSGKHSSGSGLLQRATATSRRPHSHLRQRTNTAGITRAQGQARQQPWSARVAPKQELTEKQQRMIRIIAEAIEKVVKVSGNELNAYSDAKPLPSGLRLTGDKYTDYDQDDLKTDRATITGSSGAAPSSANPTGSTASGSAASGSAPPAPAQPVSTPTISGSHPSGSTPSGFTPPNTTSLGSVTPGSATPSSDSSGSNTSSSNSFTSTPPTSDQSGEDDSNDTLSDDENASDNESLSDDDDSDEEVEFQLSKTPGSTPPTGAPSGEDSDDEDVDMDDDKAKDEAEKKAKKKAKFRRLQDDMGDVFDL